jgi:multiple antibiotic resistance protein
VSALVNGQLFLNCFVTLLVIMDPPGTLPVFLALTANAERADRIRAARQAVAVALLVIVLFAIFGQGILAYLHVSLPALQGAGGLLLLLVALSLLTDRADAEPVRTEGVNIAFVPLGTPLLAGPGAIVATMVFAGRIHSFADLAAVALGVVAVHAILYLVMRFAGVILRLLGRNGVSLVTRIAGLLLSAIAVQLVADSVRAFVEGQG